jgi:TonB-dependent SusC/RagA subfamily outer membrane receptor
MIRLELHHRTGARVAHRLGLLALTTVLAGCSQNPKASTATVPAGAGEARRPSGGAQTLGASELKPEQFQSVEEVIQGRFPGVEVVRLAGGGFSLRIRGAGSFMSGNEPLYVVDGTPLPPTPGGALIGVDPRDIESIQVLKNAPDTALYGVRGANGVIVIRTKRGR